MFINSIFEVKKMDNIKEYFLNYLNGYNKTWVDKDLEKLK